MEGMKSSMDMSKNNIQIKRLDSPDQKEKYRVSCHTMWQDIFGDSDAYMEYYMEWKWEENQVLILEEEEKGELYSMLHMNPYSILQGGRRHRLHYIVGVSTKEEQRGKGYMGMLLREMFRYLYERGEEWTYLMPAAEAIYLPYGFRSVYDPEVVEICFDQEEEENGRRCPGGGLREKGELPETCQGARVYSFSECSREKREELAAFAQDCLAGKFRVYAVHDEAYFQEIAREMRACGGELLVLESDGRLIGYGAYMYEEGEEYPVEFAETVLAEGREEEGLYLLKEYLLQQCLEKELKLPVRFTESAFLPERLRQGCSAGQKDRRTCRIMARIISFERAAKSLSKPKGWADKVVCQIRDPMILENDDIWEICFDKNETKVVRTQKIPDYSLSIEAFAELMFRQYSFYINDLV